MNDENIWVPTYVSCGKIYIGEKHYSSQEKCDEEESSDSYTGAICYSTRKTYSPDEETARMAPAAICHVVCRIVAMRKFLKDAVDNKVIDNNTARLFDQFIGPISFEKELLSGRMEEVDKAIKKLGLLESIKDINE